MSENSKLGISASLAQILIHTYWIESNFGGAQEVMVIVAGNRHGNSDFKSSTMLFSFWERYESNYYSPSYR